MALIECTECGKMISDKASACPHCGCPVEKKVTCEECGQQLSENDAVCPHCGCPVEKEKDVFVEKRSTNESIPIQAEPLEGKQNRSNTGKIIAGIGVALLCVFILIIFIVNSNTHGDSSPSYADDGPKEESVDVKLQKAETVEDAKSLIDGTTWHYTENLSSSAIGSWIKVTFSNGKFTAYYAQPSDGQWTKGGSGVYKIVEGRYANTGDKYLSVAWEDEMKLEGWLTTPCQFLLTLDDFQLHVGSKFMDGWAAASSYLEHGNPYYTPDKMDLRGKMEFGDYTWN